MLVKLTPVDTILLMFSQVHGIRRLVLTKSEKMVNVAKKPDRLFYRKHLVHFQDTFNF